MDSEFSSCDTLESMSQHGSSGPRSVTLEYLKKITNDFSEKLGEGSFGTVYKGVLPNGEPVAVKKLNSSMLLPGVTDKQFENEAYHLKRLRHPNIVLLVGWCSETQNTYVEYNGKHICAEKSERLLCLEYMPNGNLRQHLKDESSGLTWETRYKIIEGICCGLHYLHEESQLNGPIVHMDLKPENILLDNNMVPKIADFGFSRLFSEEKTKSTISRYGTLGYMPPEYINKGIISTKSDIFSLGVVIIEIVTGQRDYPDEIGGISSQEFPEHVLNTFWRNRLQKSLRDTSLEIGYKQIRRCIQIGLDCVKLDRSKRPTISQVIKMLQGTESGSLGPRSVTLEYLRNITNNFSTDRLLGEGGFGMVYKGVLPNGETVAVKKLNSSMLLPGVTDKQFENEAYHLKRLRHPNIVLLVGWCSETQNTYVEYNGKHICAEKSERLLCLEYMPNGNLRQHLKDESSGLTWETRYKIIEGICYGLHYLHEESQLNGPIVHMDLKPENILLDNNMLPKIADFGFSRLFSEEKTKSTINRYGTLGYMPPEYINRGIISTKSDIFSLGVIIIEIVTGQRDYPDEIGGISSQEFTDLVLQNWRNRLQKSLSYASLEIDYQQIKRCIWVGLDCVKLDRSKRPTISQVIKMLKETESAVQSMPLEFLRSITKHFSEKQKLGSGTFGTVYKGVYNGEEFAVKMLHEIIGADESQFQNEFLNLLSINHPHIIKSIGYCYEMHNEHVEYNGELSSSQRTYRAMCLEYMQGGSLDKYLTACYNGSCDRDWRTLFNIIKGVCEGLYFLHEGCGTPILHLDLKPANILLDHNMVAKIADFGLSRLFQQGASTHVTQRESVTGTTKYMAPEYEDIKMMSPEIDVFSLGVTMIEVMAGPTGYDAFCEMGDVKKFIDQVNTDWTKQIKATTSPCASTESDQVDICITIAMKCVDGERNNRPTIAEIVHKLKETEKRFLQLLMDQSLSSHHIIKSGVVGGKAGTARDMEEKPRRLESLTITYIGLVDAFSFSYIDKAGKQQTVGPWGEADKGYSDAKTKTILFEPSEFVEEVSGAYGSHFDKILMMSLTFVTNIRTYGPFGNPYHQNVTSTPFSFRAAEDSSIVGFHGRSGQFLYSLGVYKTQCPSSTKIPRPLPMPGQTLPSPTKSRPSGGSGGIARDIQQKPWRLESLTISYYGLIDAFSFSYTDQDGKKQSNGRWGRGYKQDNIETIRFETSEFLEEVSGALGSPFGKLLVKSLTFVTNIRTYGPFGNPYHSNLTPTPFRFRADKDSRIVGFHGRSGSHLYSIGVYTIKHPQLVPI